MRLNKREIDAIRSAVFSFDPGARIYLYGSRASDHLTGGDIDLLLLSNKISFADKISILTEIKRLLGEQKIDLTVKTHAAAEIDSFVTSILAGAIEIG